MLEQQRRELLAAMGIDVYLLRTRAAGQPDAEPARLADHHGASLVVACATGSSDKATARLRELLPLVLGISAERMLWIGPRSDGELAEVPSAPAYLALGAEMPRALGAHLSTMQQMSATIAAADAPAASLRDGLAKRVLWQALKPLARQLRPR
jgi:hypothetical protein